MEKSKELLKLARDMIKSHLYGEKIKVNDEIKKKYSKKQACFVTLTEKGKLRGCIGSLQACQELWKDIIDNSIHAAFDDARFDSLSKNELDKIKIEISILSIPLKLKYTDPDDLINKIDNKMGIVLKSGLYSATFLPQVWEELPNKIEFLENLSRKAGLSCDAWKQGCEIMFYRVESFKE
ncbi:Uncharacterised protein [uncultured archaeon]|nr:Uncharacterised protein [uncultured archaeon]